MRDLEKKAEKRRDKSVLYSTASVSRAGKDDGWNTMDWSLAARRSSRILVRGSTGNSAKGIPGDHSCSYEKLPFGPMSRTTGEADPYSMKVGESRFERCVREMPDRISFNPSPVSSSR